MSGSHDDPLERIFGDMMADVEPVEPPSFPGYTLLERIGSGGFGSVYRARDETLHRLVAVKLLRPDPDRRPEERAALLEEARALARIRHPKVVTIYGVLEQGPLYGLCMELVRGSDLETIVRERGPLSAPDVIRVARDLCEALGAVHAAGLVHRDVKTSNVMRDRDDRILLTDFGLGIPIARASEESGAGIAGSPAFMAPEQLLGSPASYACDIYSLGVVLYHIAVGRLPFEADELAALLEAKLESRYEPLSELRPDLPRCLIDVVTRALRPAAEDRFESIADIADALADCGTAEASSTQVSASRRSARRTAAKWIVGLVLALGVVLAMVWPVADGAFRVEAAVLVATRQGPATELQAGALPPETPFYVRMRATRDLHVYVLLEDDRARKYVLLPPGGASALSPMEAGAIGWLPGDPATGARGLRVESPEVRAWVLLLASPEPIGPIEDGIPPGGTSETTGKEGYPRLKPATVRGLLRVLRDRGVTAVPEDPADTGEDGEKWVLAEAVRGLDAAGRETAADNVWIRRIPVASAPRARRARD